MSTYSPYIDTLKLNNALASTKDDFTVFSLTIQSINSKFITSLHFYRTYATKALALTQHVYRKAGSEEFIYDLYESSAIWEDIFLDIYGSNLKKTYHNM